MNYWKNKQSMIIHAEEHLTFCLSNFDAEIKSCVANSKIYTETSKLSTGAGNNLTTKQIVVQLDVVSAVFELRKLYPTSKIAVLNFASYKNPGGMFLQGSSAQEESICHASILFPVLSQLELDYYQYNRKHLNRALYTNRAIYTPDIIFMHEGNVTSVDVLTCAAPNYTAARKYQQITLEQNSAALYSRINFVFDILEENNVDIFLSGAYGCGVFGQNPVEVATFMKNRANRSYIPNVVYAIPSGYNLHAFEQIIGE